MQKVRFPVSKGVTLCGIISVPKDASSVVIMSHGFSSSKDSRIYAELQEMLNERGIGALRYDCYGHGESDGKLEDVTLSTAFYSLFLAMDFVNDAADYDIGLLGASFGGLVSAVAASLRPENVKALALKSPVTDPMKFWRNRIGEEGILKWGREKVLHYDDLGERYDLKYKFWEDLRQHDAVEITRGISCPTLIVHGSADRVVPISQSMELAGRLGVDVNVIEGADHAYSNPAHYERAKKEMVNFLAGHLKPQS